MDINDKDEWTLIVASLGDHELRAERDRLQNSIQHLKRSNEELEEFVTDDPELQEVIDDNSKVIGSQTMRIDVLKAEISKRGISEVEEGVVTGATSSGPKIEEVIDDTDTEGGNDRAGVAATQTESTQTDSAQSEEPSVQPETAESETAQSETIIHL